MSVRVECKIEAGVPEYGEEIIDLGWIETDAGINICAQVDAISPEMVELSTRLFRRIKRLLDGSDEECATILSEMKNRKDDHLAGRG